MSEKKSTMEARTPLEKAFDCIIDIFHEYSTKEKHHDRLNKGELAKLMREQLPNFCQSKRNPGCIEDLFKDLDKNKDNEVSFDEAMVLVCRALIKIHNKFHDDHDHGHGHGHSH